MIVTVILCYKNKNEMNYKPIALHMDNSCYPWHYLGNR